MVRIYLAQRNQGHPKIHPKSSWRPKDQGLRQVGVHQATRQDHQVQAPLLQVSIYSGH